MCIYTYHELLQDLYYFNIDKGSNFSISLYVNAAFYKVITRILNYVHFDTGIH